MEIAVTALAVLWAWEYLLLLSPVHIAAWFQPALVAGCAFGASYVPQGVVTACAVGGAVALLHRALQASDVAAVTRRARRGVPRI